MSIYVYIFTMALTTYLIRVLPLTIFRKPIRSRFLRSFLHYVPYACLTAMTFPAILSSTASILSGAAALIVAIILAYRGKSLIVVALSSSAITWVPVLKTVSAGISIVICTVAAAGICAALLPTPEEAEAAV